ncbi:CotS family spore coat protein [Paenibacillus eucommiae]|uniref:CotS family spore coat protein n=1 Tax=Paenibacillus eucommiae TaxID=1355755 RepID=A0ABS4ITS1_9BACL|nr:CotS family spore coat protein [Paenibacillus eucommiae]MBP1990982.1 CotS family spore coat protein [Paenibacillus eucommiae]
MDRLLRSIEQLYGFKIKTWKVIKHIKNSSFVALIKTDEGKKKIVKSLYITPERQLFIVKSEQLLAEKGVKLARPIPSLQGELYMIFDKVPYVLYEWIDGKSRQLRDRDALESMVQVMARFHRASRGLDYPNEVQIYSHLPWEQDYKQRLKSLKSWHSKHKGSNNRKAVIISRHLPFFQKMAQKALESLHTSHYQNYMDGLDSAKSLVHGDFHHMNLIFQKDVGVLIDFEDVRYDLPSKDLLRIFSMYTKQNPFEGKMFRGMMKTYENINPFPTEVRQLVYMDLLFPHIFERMLRKKKYKKMSAPELKEWIKQEKEKALYVYDHDFKPQH